jgi:hypothetical protein
MLNSRNLNASSDRWRFFYGVELEASIQPQWGQCQGFWGVAIGISQLGQRPVNRGWVLSRARGSAMLLGGLVIGSPA